MKSCCESKCDELAVLMHKQRHVLQIVLAINAVMFLVEAAGGYLAGSSALQADSLDMFGDAATYAFSLYVLGRSPAWTARAGLLKGGIMAAFGAVVLGQVAVRAAYGIVPEAGAMGALGFLALAANASCLALLYRHRSDDINMRSTWLCSRNDIIANLGVLAASGLVALTSSLWPDLVVGTAIAFLFLGSSVSVLSESWKQLGAAAKEPRLRPQ